MCLQINVSIKFLIIFEPKPVWKRGCIYIVFTILYRHRQTTLIHCFISLRFFDIVETGSRRYCFGTGRLAGVLSPSTTVAILAGTLTLRSVGLLVALSRGWVAADDPSALPMGLERQTRAMCPILLQLLQIGLPSAVRLFGRVPSAPGGLIHLACTFVLS